MDQVNILGVGVTPLHMQQTLETIDTWIASQQREYVCVANVYTIMLCQRDPHFRHIYNQAGMVTPDGMPLVWVGRLAGFPQVKRVYGPDLMLSLCEHSISKGHRHFFYGGTEGTADLLVEKLKAYFPDLQVVGTYTPPFRELNVAEQEQITHKINTAKPDIIWIGLGAPKQEYWMSQFREHLQAPVLIGVGVAFDYHSGRKQQAPRWLQKIGLEWSYRLLKEPRRLWRRYFPNNFLFIVLVIAQRLGIKRYRLD